MIKNAMKIIALERVIDVYTRDKERLEKKLEIYEETVAHYAELEYWVEVGGDWIYCGYSESDSKAVRLDGPTVALQAIEDAEKVK